MYRHFLLLTTLLLGWTSALLWGQAPTSCVGLAFTHQSANPGDTVTLHLTVRSFEQVLGLQYTHQWDPAQLQLLGVTPNPALAITANNFNLLPSQGGQGYLPFAWLDPDVQGETLADGDTLYGLRFRWLPTGGQPTYVTTNGQFTPIEWVTVTHNPTSYWFGHGMVASVSQQGPTAPLGVDAACLTPQGCQGAGNGAIDVLALGQTGPHVYSWTGPGGFTSADTSLSGLIPGQYELSLLPPSGPARLASFYLGNEAGISLSAVVTNASCDATTADGAINLTVTAPPLAHPLTYMWSNGATTADLNQLAPGQYTVTVSSSNGCSQTATYSVSETFNPVISVDIVPASCQGQLASGSLVLHLQNGQSNYQYSWSNGDTDAVLSNLTGGNYSVTITSPGGGCTFEATYFVPQDHLELSSSTLCGPQSASVSVAVWNDPNGQYTFNWSNGQVTTSNFISTIQVPLANTNYSVTVTDPNGCTGVLNNIPLDCLPNDEITLRITPSLSQANTGDQVCVQITADEFRGIRGLQFSLQWDPQMLQFEAISSFDLPSLAANNFNLFPSLLATGRTAVSWTAPNLAEGVTLPDQAALFEVCFQVIAGTGVTNVGFSETPVPSEFINNQDQAMDVVFVSGQVQINGGNQPPGIGLLGATVQGAVGELTYLDFTVDNFLDIAGLQFTARWNPNQLQLVDANLLNLPGASATANLGPNTEAVDDGALRVLWLSPTSFGYNLGHGTPILRLAFVPLQTGQHSVLISGTPLPILAANGNLESVPVSTQAGVVQVATQVQPPVSLSLMGVGAEPGQPLCVPLYAEQLNDVVSFQFSLRWDPTVATFTSLSPTAALPGFNTSHYSQGAGYLNFSYIHPNLSALQVSPGVKLLDLCFTAAATPGETALYFSDQPTAIEFASPGGGVLPFVPLNGRITVSAEALVWPGDAGNNGIANHFDLLPLGLGYQTPGARRYRPRSIWQAQYADAWNGNTPTSGVNYRHADTDGNGLINAADTLAIVANWDEVTPLWEPLSEDFRSELTGTPFLVLPDTFDVGQTVSLPIVLGSADNPAPPVYGLAFSLSYDPVATVPGSAYLSFAPSWLAQNGPAPLVLYRDYPAESRLDVAITRIDQQNVTGYGEIGQLHITLEDVIFQRGPAYEMPLRIENVRLIDASEVAHPVDARQTISLVVSPTGVNEADALPQLQLAPNPTTGWVSLTGEGYTLQRVEVLSLAGQVLLSQGSDSQVDVAALPAGLYWLRATTNQGVALRKLIKI